MSSSLVSLSRATHVFYIHCVHSGNAASCFAVVFAQLCFPAVTERICTDRTRNDSPRNIASSCKLIFNQPIILWVIGLGVVLSGNTPTLTVQLSPSPSAVCLCERETKRWRGRDGGVYSVLLYVTVFSQTVPTHRPTSARRAHVVVWANVRARSHTPAVHERSCTRIESDVGGACAGADRACASEPSRLGLAVWSLCSSSGRKLQFVALSQRRRGEGERLRAAIKEPELSDYLTRGGSL